MNTLIKSKRIALLTILSALALSGCIRDDDECRQSCSMVIRVLDEDGKDITQTAAIDDVLLYLFCSQGNYLDKIEVPAQDIRNYKPVILDYPSQMNVTAVAWANLAGCSNTNPDNIESSRLSDQTYVRLYNWGSGARDGVDDDEREFRSPNEFFQGYKTVEFQKGSGSYTDDIVIRPKVSKINITTKNLRKYAGSQEWEKFSFVLYGTRDRINFITGAPEGDPALYRPGLELESAANTARANIRTFPCAPNPVLELRIYKESDTPGGGRTRIFTADADSQGNPFVAYAGRSLDITVDFTAGIEITAEVGPWDESGQETEF